MRKVISVLMTAISAISFLLLITSTASASVQKCYDDYKECRERILNDPDMGTIQTTIHLTMCDVAFDACLIANAIKN